ncbi:hypothetical protein [Flexithrix dorotheae]|uniref:hypothetical protein n=1 Tax=Flexithrix dorotheae TaxID=70993 RepID=UPI000373DC1A|nr:hypothetical protein [Flexithrix dorotheae]
MKELNFKNASEYLSKLRSTFYIMVGFPLPVFLYVYFASRENNYSPVLKAIPDYLLVSIPVVCFGMAAFAYIAFFRKLKVSRTISDLREKLTHYYTISLNKFIWLEVASVVNVLIYFLSGNIVFAGLYIAMLILFAMNNPNYFSVVGDLRLSKTEKEIMKQNMTIP